MTWMHDMSKQDCNRDWLGDSDSTSNRDAQSGLGSRLEALIAAQFALCRRALKGTAQVAFTRFMSTSLRNVDNALSLVQAEMLCEVEANFKFASSRVLSALAVN